MENCIENASSKMNHKNVLLDTITSTISFILELHFVVLNVIWAILEGIYRIVIPVSEKSVKGEIVLITGAGHGIGRELALLYAAQEAVVICVDVNEINNEDTVNAITKMGYNKVYAYTCDVSNCDQITKVCAKIEEDVGEITILINNAGIMPHKEFLKYSRTDIEKIFNTNLFSQIWFLQTILPSMLKRNYGHIVAISSMCGIEGLGNLVPYCTSKFAVRGLMASLRKELLEKEIKTTTVYPFAIDTGLADSTLIRFPHLTPMLKKEDVAKFIISAQRRDVVEVTIPSYLFNLFLFIKSLPTKAEKSIIDFMGITIQTE